MGYTSNGPSGNCKAVSGNIQVFDSGDGRFCLTAMIEEDVPDAVFAEMELQGGGYTWEAVFRALLRMRLPQAVGKLDTGAEADNMYSYSDEGEILEQAASLLRAAATDRSLLLEAIREAKDEIE
jgi:hypothetical protein